MGLDALDRYCGRCGTPVNPDMRHPVEEMTLQGNRALTRRAMRDAVPAFAVMIVGAVMMAPALIGGLVGSIPTFVAWLFFIGFPVMIVGAVWRARIVTRGMGWPRV